VIDDFSSIFPIEATDGKSCVLFNTKILFFFYMLSQVSMFLEIKKMGRCK